MNREILIKRIAREFVRQLLNEIEVIEIGRSSVRHRIDNEQDWHTFLDDDACWMICADLADSYLDNETEPTGEKIARDLRKYLDATRDGYGRLSAWIPEEDEK